MVHKNKLIITSLLLVIASSIFAISNCDESRYWGATGPNSLYYECLQGNTNMLESQVESNRSTVKTFTFNIDCSNNTESNQCIYDGTENFSRNYNISSSFDGISTAKIDFYCIYTRETTDTNVNSVNAGVRIINISKVNTTSGTITNNTFSGYTTKSPDGSAIGMLTTSDPKKAGESGDTLFYDRGAGDTPELQLNKTQADTYHALCTLSLSDVVYQ